MTCCGNSSQRFDISRAHPAGARYVCDATRSVVASMYGPAMGESRARMVALGAQLARIRHEDASHSRRRSVVPQAVAQMCHREPGHRRIRPDVVGEVGDATPRTVAKPRYPSWVGSVGPHGVSSPPLRARVPTFPRSSPRSASWRRCSPQHPRSANWRRYSPRRQSQRSGVGARRTARDCELSPVIAAAPEAGKLAPPIATAEAGKLAPAIAAAPERGRAQSESWHAVRRGG